MHCTAILLDLSVRQYNACIHSLDHVHDRITTHAWLVARSTEAIVVPLLVNKCSQGHPLPVSSTDDCVIVCVGCRYDEAAWYQKWLNVLFDSLIRPSWFPP